MSGRIVQGADDWMRDQERRLLRQERRPAPASFADQLGPGITQRSRMIVDWNDPANLRNGWYFSDVLSLNTPNPFVAWLGMVMVASDGRGVQKLWSHEPGVRPSEYMREFHYNGAIPVFTQWSEAGASTQWFTMPLGNGWYNYGGGHQIAQYRRHNGVVYLRGLVIGTSRTNALFFSMPQGFRSGTLDKQLFSGTSEGPSTRFDLEGGQYLTCNDTPVTFLSLNQAFWIAEA